MNNNKNNNGGEGEKVIKNKKKSTPCPHCGFLRHTKNSFCIGKNKKNKKNNDFDNDNE